MSDRLNMRGPGRGALPGSRPERDRLGGGAALCQVMRQQFGFLLLQLRKAFAQDRGDLPMQYLALTLQHRLIGGVSNERMLEQVFAVRRQAVTFDQARPGQIQQSLSEFGFRRFSYD